jgi:hypothetical protein
VASALHETANQQVFGLAKEADPNGTRTVGILTKPDAVQPGDEPQVINVAKNRITQLTHGWFVLRNRSTEEIAKGTTSEQRRKNEIAFFQRDPWRTLDKHRVGIQALETFLRDLLYEHVRKEFPKMLKELETKVTTLRSDIKALGSPRETPDQQRGVLLELANQFQLDARDSLMGLYHLSTDALDDNLRLRNNIRNLNDSFAENVRSLGHLHNFDSENAEAEIREWISKVHSRSRGVELDGLVNIDVFKTLFREQTVKWESIAKQHMIRVTVEVKEFIRTLLNRHCRDRDLCSAVWSFLSPLFSECFERAGKELDGLLHDERGDVMLTYDAGFIKTLENIRKGRMLEDMSKVHLVDKGLEEGQTIRNVIVEIFDEAYHSREEQAVQELYDYLRSYYKVARTRFIDCVCLQVIERHFLGPNGAVKAFSPALVGKITVEKLQLIAGEEYSIVNERGALKERLDRLEKALVIAHDGYI